MTNDPAELRAVLAGIDDADLAGGLDERAVALCSASVTLAELFPTLAHRAYLTMPVRLLPTKMHGPFGKKSWKWLIARSPSELTDYGRIDLEAIGALMVSLRAETAIVERAAS